MNDLAPVRRLAPTLLPQRSVICLMLEAAFAAVV